MRALDLAPLLRSSVGFENLNRLVDFATRGEGDAYPPYNIEKLGEGTYRISMAVAGFGQDELDLTVQENVLIVTGRAQAGTETADRQLLPRGIAQPAFARRFPPPATLQVKGAGYVHGLFTMAPDRKNVV